MDYPQTYGGMKRLTDEDIALQYLAEREFKVDALPTFEALVELLIEYPTYHEDKRTKHILENSPEIRQRLIDIAAKMDLPINKEA